jgi:hypothetical protein
VEEWKEVQYPDAEPGPIYAFRRGYRVRDAGKHETAEQFSCFQQYLTMGPGRTLKDLGSISGHSTVTLSGWLKKYQWERRVAAWVKDQMAVTLRQTGKIDRDAHRAAIVEFRQNSEKQARLMSRVSEDLVRVLGKRIAKAEENNETIPLHQVGGLLRAAASLSEQSRESWGNALGITELLDVVDAEVEKVRIEEITEEDPYEFEIDE